MQQSIAVVKEFPRFDLCSDGGIVAAFKQDIINKIRRQNIFSCEELWYQGYVYELKRRGFTDGEITSIEDEAVAAARA